jgi:hypothetical protein
VTLQRSLTCQCACSSAHWEPGPARQRVPLHRQRNSDHGGRRGPTSDSIPRVSVFPFLRSRSPRSSTPTALWIKAGLAHLFPVPPPPKLPPCAINQREERCGRREQSRQRRRSGPRLGVRGLHLAGRVASVARTLGIRRGPRRNSSPCPLRRREPAPRRGRATTVANPR